MIYITCPFHIFIERDKKYLTMLKDMQSKKIALGQKVFGLAYELGTKYILYS